ncbi:MAG: type II toxin-antitoxin system VapC family toxin [Thermoguttaceae bacterium]|jgi:predicted nucleic acid-binding protein
MIVVDSNVIIYFLISSDFSELSRKAEQTFFKDPHWIAPPLWRSEVRNVLAYYIRKRFLTLEAAKRLMEKALNLMTGPEHDEDSSHILQLAAESTCTAYDCEFVALSRDLGVPLVTVDKKVLSQFPDVAIALDKYVAV